MYALLKYSIIHPVDDTLKVVFGHILLSTIAGTYYNTLIAI